MGDRSNIVVRETWRGVTTPGVWLYGHWMGPGNITTLRDVIREGRRLDDGPYLARIIFSRMVGASLNAETGYGIWTNAPDNEYPVLVVDTGKGTVEVYADSDISGTAVTTLTFAEFLEKAASGKYRDLGVEHYVDEYEDY